MSTFQINSKEFLKALNFAGKAQVNNPIIPILECVLIESKSKNLLSITGSDGNTTISTDCGMHDCDSVIFKLAAPYELLSKTLSGLPNTPITVTYSEQGEFDYLLTIGFGEDIYKIPCEDPNVFLKTPTFTDAKSISMPGNSLSRAISMVSHCVSSDDLRPAMTGVFMSVNNDSIEFCATNGHILANYKTSFESVESEIKVIIPAKFSRFLSEAIGETESEVILSVGSRFMSVEFGEWKAYCSLIDERYPDFKNAIPTDFEYEAVLNSESIKASLKRAIAYANISTSLAKFTFYGSKLQLDADETDLNRSASQKIDIESDIDSFTIGFNLKIFAGLLSTVNGDFNIKMISANRAAMIFPEARKNEEIQYLIMPVMLNTAVPA